jgi:hypothetical protein
MFTHEQSHLHYEFMKYNFYMQTLPQNPTQVGAAWHWVCPYNFTCKHKTPQTTVSLPDMCKL